MTESERRPSTLTYALTRRCLRELNEEKNPVPENIGVVAGEITAAGCEHFAVAFVVVGETLVLPVTLGIDIGRFVKRKLTSRSS